MDDQRGTDTGTGTRYPEHWEADVVLRDGGTAHIRPIRPDDAERLVEFYADVSDESKYYRFFAPYPRLSDRDVHRFTHHDYVDRVGLAAVIGDEFIATVRYDRLDETDDTDDPAQTAEVAFLVQDAHQGRGVASALLEHISAAARERGILRFAAEVLPGNRKMIKVFTDAGYTQQRTFSDGVIRLELDLAPTETQLEVMRAREHRAEARSVQRLLAPASVAVIGAGRVPGGYGRTVLRHLVSSGFRGEVHAVNRALAALARSPAPEGQPSTGTAELEGVPVYATVAEIPGQLDLAVLAVPADEVPEVVAACGAHGVRGIVVVSSGWADAGAAGQSRQRGLVRLVRSFGMRLIGPNALGLINTDERVRLNASLAPRPPHGPRLEHLGGIGLFTQSPAIGVAALAEARRRGLGLSSFVSSGNRADLSGNDMLQCWEEDPRTSVAVLYLESFGNPRKFTRLARRIGRSKPLVVVKAGRHTGAVPPGHAVTPTQISDETVDTLFRQAGVIRVETLTEMWDAAELLQLQPLPDGERVAVVGNSEAVALLTEDSCVSAGLHPVAREVSSDPGAADFARALAAAIASPDNDAVLAVAVPALGAPDDEPDGGPGNEPADAAEPESPAGALLGPLPGADPEPLMRTLAAAAEQARAAGKPLLLVHLAMDGLGQLLRRHGTETSPLRAVPAYPAPERAVRALGEAVHYSAWRRAEAASGRVPVFEDLDETSARALVDEALAAAESQQAGHPDADADPAPVELAPVELGPERTARLLTAYGITVLPTVPAPDPDSAVAAAELLGYPVALKTTAAALRHRADLGGVRLDLSDEAELRRAHREQTERLGGRDAAGLAVQAMAPRGVPTVISAGVSPDVGAVLSFGLSGAPAELLGDVAHRLLPATERDVAALVRAIRAAPLLFGWRGADPVDTEALETLLLRLAVMLHDLPEIAAAELEPVVVARRGTAVLGAEIRITRPPARTDLGPRTLRGF